MNKQELIEKAVLAFEGKWLFPFSNLCTPAPSNTAFEPHSKFDSIRNTNYLGPHWSFVCTKEEFEACAKRMGYINGYRRGVEYPTNGRKQNLNGDVMCLVKFTGRPDFSQIDCVINNWAFDQTSHFKITDQRYKPVSEIPESKPDAVVVSENPESNWFEAGELPPVGTVCEYNTTVKFDKCKIVAINGKAIAFTCEENSNTIFVSTAEEAQFRPIRTERENFIDAAWNCLSGDMNHDEAVSMFGQLYDAGVRWPESE